MRGLKKIFVISSILVLCFVMGVRASVTPEPVKISSAEELFLLEDNPYGSYILTRDIDMAGVDWKPVDFYGEFNGNGHAVLNVKVSSVSAARAVTYDGNMKTYDTTFAGFFGKLETANVYDLKLINIRVEVESSEPCFAGGFAGYMDRALIENCEISGEIKLTASAPMFGVGGMAGFGNGDIKNTVSDMTLICVDKDVNQKDEQFMGGAYAAGYIGIDHCDIKINGYVSDHGYVHNGGMVGMYAVYPVGNDYKSYITYNHVDGQITFFEDNTDRRAYCKAYVGEVLHWTYAWAGCSENFKSNEVFDYSKDLYPDMCNASFSTNVVASTNTEYGYTEYKCDACGYTYRDKYVLKQPDLALLQAEIESKKAYEETSLAALEEESTESVSASVKKTKKDVQDNSKKTNAYIFGGAMAALLIILVGAVLMMSKRR